MGAMKQLYIGLRESGDVNQVGDFLFGVQRTIPRAFARGLAERTNQSAVLSAKGGGCIINKKKDVITS